MNFELLTDMEIWDVANPIMDDLMAASTNIDYTKHVLAFTDRAKNIVTKEHFKRVCKKYQSEKGTWLAREPAALFKRPDSAAIIWKQFCSKAKGEFVAEIVLIHDGKKYLVDHAMIF